MFTQCFPDYIFSLGRYNLLLLSKFLGKEAKYLLSSAFLGGQDSVLLPFKSAMSHAGRHELTKRLMRGWHMALIDYTGSRTVRFKRTS